MGKSWGLVCAGACDNAATGPGLRRCHQTLVARLTTWAGQATVGVGAVQVVLRS